MVKTQSRLQHRIVAMATQCSRKICCSLERAGSSPASATNIVLSHWAFLLCLLTNRNRRLTAWTDRQYGECGVMVAHLLWEQEEWFKSNIFHHVLEQFNGKTAGLYPVAPDQRLFRVQIPVPVPRLFLVFLQSYAKKKYKYAIRKLQIGVITTFNSFILQIGQTDKSQGS